jgi:hypothetical protein
MRKLIAKFLLVGVLTVTLGSGMVQAGGFGHNGDSKPKMVCDEVTKECMTNCGCFFHMIEDFLSDIF